MEQNCFLCGQMIKGKTTQEHVFANSFLAEFDLKRERLQFGAPKPIEYSRIKVPAHRSCNSEIGSKFESYLLQIIRSMDTNLDVLAQLHLAHHPKVAANAKEMFCQWLAKLHLGLIHWEVNLKRHPNSYYKTLLENYIETPVVTCLQRCFSEWHYFNCPSSLYHFSVPPPPERAFRFDFGSRHEISGTFIKFGTHLLVTTIGDGRLVEEWFTDHQHKITQGYILTSPENPLAYLSAVAHIWAVRELLPVQPQLEFTSHSIRDLSRKGLDQKPAINEEAINARADQLFDELAQRFKRDDRAGHIASNTD